MAGGKAGAARGAQGMPGAIDMAERVVGQRKGAYMLQQFESEANPEVHYRTTGPEIWRDTAGTIDVLVAGAPPPPPRPLPTICAHVLPLYEPHTFPGVEMNTVPVAQGQ